jgi:spore germination protein KC
LKVNPEEKRKINQYVNVLVFPKKHDLKINVSKNNQVSADVKISLKVHVIEYPTNNLASKRAIETLSKKINEQLTKKAQEVISEIQRANCDYLGIGRQVQAYYPKSWTAMDWNQVYPTIQINPTIQTQINQTGIIK